MKKFFIHELKKSAFPIGIIAIVATAIYMTFTLMQDQSTDIRSNVGVIAFIGGALAMAVPIWMLNYKMNKRSVDLYYALPLKRVEILAVRYLIGLIAVALPFTLAYWSGALATYLNVLHDNPFGMNSIYYTPYYFSAIGGLLCIYSISSFAFTRANRTIDGILFIVFWMLALLVLLSAVDTLAGNYCEVCGSSEFHGYNMVHYIYSGYFSPVSPLSTATDYFEIMLNNNAFRSQQIIFNTNQKINMGVGFGVTALCVIAANVWLFLGENSVRAENVGQVSESPFGYLVMIPLFTASLIVIAHSVPLAVIIVIGGYALSAVYRHTLKIGVKQGIIFAASAVVGISLMLVYLFVLHDFRI